MIGEMVKTIRGRDSERYFLVVDISDKFVYICDGKVHPLEKPKKKNKSHIISNGNINDTIRQKILTKNISNKELREIIKLSLNQDVLGNKEV